MAVYAGELYAGTYNATLGAQVWKYNGTPPWSDVTIGGGFNGSNDILSMALHGANLYAGTYCGSGAQIWEYNGAAWGQVNTDGFGDTSNLGAYGLAEYNGLLYAGTFNMPTGTEAWVKAVEYYLDIADGTDDPAHGLSPECRGGGAYAYPDETDTLLNITQNNLTIQGDGVASTIVTEETPPSSTGPKVSASTRQTSPSRTLLFVIFRLMGSISTIAALESKEMRYMTTKQAFIC